MDCLVGVGLKDIPVLQRRFGDLSYRRNVSCMAWIAQRQLLCRHVQRIAPTHTGPSADCLASDARIDSRLRGLAQPIIDLDRYCELRQANTTKGKAVLVAPDDRLGWP